MTKIKICGITNIEDALTAARFGASALGFNFYSQSPRFISDEEALKIVQKLPSGVCKIGVFVNEQTQNVNEISQALGLDAVQLHGDETPDYCRQITTKVIKAIRVKDENDLEIMPQYTVWAFILDSHSLGFGGSGQRFDWRPAARKLAGLSSDAHIILSGGLTAQNVSEAIEVFKPYAVDVCSGVESVAGVKDYQKLARFIEAVKAVL